MDAEGIVALLEALGTKATTGDQWVRGSCPLAPWLHDGGTDKHPSFGIEVVTGGESWFNCYSCGKKGDLLTLVGEAHRLNKMDPLVSYDWKTAREIASSELEVVVSHVKDFEVVQKTPKPDTVTIFPKEWVESFPKVTSGCSAGALDYLKLRNLTTYGEIEAYDIRWDSTQQRVCFPVYLPPKICVGLHGRAIMPEATLPYYAYGFQSKRNPHVWYGEQWLDLKSPVVLTEGPFDLTQIAKVYSNVLASFTASLSLRKLKRVRDFIGIITYYDHGSGGEEAREALTAEAQHHHIPIIHIVPTEEEDDAGNTHVKKIAEYLYSVLKIG